MPFDDIQDHEPDRVLAFTDAYGASREPFSAWVREVSRSYLSSRLTLEAASRLAGARPAELAAVLELATLEDDELELLDEDVPPSTTWFALAGASSEGLRAALAALREDDTASPTRAVRSAIHAVEGPAAVERVVGLDPAIFGHLARKAKQYDLLRPRDRSALVSFSRQLRSGRTLTQRQAAYALSLVQQLVDGGAIRRRSPDEDQDVCDAVLDALGHPG